MALTVILSLLPISFIGWQVHFFFAAPPPSGLGLELLNQVPLSVWKIQYWIAEMLVASFYSITLALGYWLTTKYWMRERWTALLLGITAFYQWGCGLFDWLWFLIHALMGHTAEIPSLTTVWWWNPYHWYLGIEWTTTHHIIYTIILEAIFICLWIRWHYWTNSDKVKYS